MQNSKSKIQDSKSNNQKTKFKIKLRKSVAFLLLIGGKQEHTRWQGAARLLVAGVTAYDDFFEIAQCEHT